MLREIGRRGLSSVPFGAGETTIGGGTAADLAEKELNLRSFPRPESGVGPARVSSQSLSRSPITTTELDEQELYMEKSIRNKKVLL